MKFFDDGAALSARNVSNSIGIPLKVKPRPKDFIRKFFLWRNHQNMLGYLLVGPRKGAENHHGTVFTSH